MAKNLPGGNFFVRLPYAVYRMTAQDTRTGSQLLFVLLLQLRLQLLHEHLNSSWGPRGMLNRAHGFLEPGGVLRTLPPEGVLGGF